MVNTSLLEIDLFEVNENSVRDTARFSLKIAEDLMNKYEESPREYGFCLSVAEKNLKFAQARSIKNTFEQTERLGRLKYNSH